MSSDQRHNQYISGWENYLDENIEHLRWDEYETEFEYQRNSNNTRHLRRSDKHTSKGDIDFLLYSDDREELAAIEVKSVIANSNHGRNYLDKAARQLRKAEESLDNIFHEQGQEADFEGFIVTNNPRRINNEELKEEFLLHPDETNYADFKMII